MSRLPSRGSVKPKLRRALADWFQAHRDHPFYVGVGGRLAYVRVSKEWPLPYAVLSIPVVIGCDTTTERIDNVSVDIMVYAASSIEAEELAGLASDLFEGRVISGEGLKDFEFWRGEPVPSLPDDGGTWRDGIQLSGTVETAM